MSWESADDPHLEHDREDCAGDWIREPAPAGSTWANILRCSRCDRCHAGKPEALLAAVEENYWGIVLKQLTEDGRLLFRRQSRT